MPLRAVKPPHETRTRILDAAEELFMQHGFEGTSMRLLTAKAGGQPRRGQLPLRLQGRADRSAVPAPPRPDERGAHRRARPAGDGSRRPGARARSHHPRLRRREPAHDRGQPGTAGAISSACSAAPTPSRRSRSARSSARCTRPPWSASRRRFERALPQMPRERAGLAHAFHVRHAVLHARRHRHGAAHRRLQARRPPRRAAARGRGSTAFLAAGLAAPLKTAVRKAA